MNDNKKEEIFVTKDKDLIKQYYELRNRIFREEWELTHEKWAKTEHDDGSEIVVYTVNGKVRGGLKIFISKNGELLSEEYEGTEYVYSNLLKKLDLKCDKRYAEFADLMIEKGFRDISNVKKIVRVAVENIVLEKCAYLFYISPSIYSNLYKISLRSCGHSNIKMFKDVVWNKVSEYNYSKDHPAVVLL